MPQRSTAACCPPSAPQRVAPGGPPASASELSIVIVEEDRDRALLIVDILRAAGDFDIHVLAQRTGLARQISARNPDIVLVDVASPSRDMLVELTLASSPLDRPVAMFVDESDGPLTKAP
jgi:response regulator NasT